MVGKKRRWGNVVSCYHLLNVDVEDRWLWKLYSTTKGYSMSNAYNYLTWVDVINLLEDINILWLKVVPLKVSLFVWQMLLDRITTKDKYHRRGISNYDDQTCT